jgi:copper chaperone CopZ
MSEAQDQGLSRAFTVTRRFRISTPAAPEQADSIAASLLEVDGIDKVRIRTGAIRVRVTYDASRIDFGQIEQLLVDWGYPPPGHWWHRAKRAWYCFLDENARDNARSSPGHCCSKPTDVYASRKRP